MSKAMAETVGVLVEQSLDQAQRVQALVESVHVLTAAVAVALDVRGDRAKVVASITSMAPPVAKVGIGYQATLGQIAADPVQERLRPAPVSIETVADHLEQALKLFRDVAQLQQESVVAVNRAVSATSDTRSELAALKDELRGTMARSQAPIRPYDSGMITASDK